MKEKTRTYLYIISSFVIALLLAVNAHAQYGDIVKLTVTGDGNPLGGVPVEASQGGVSADYAMTDSSGVAEFYALSDGTYDFTIKPAEAYGCTTCALYAEKTLEDVTVTIVSNLDDLGTYALTAYDQTVTVTVLVGETTSQPNSPSAIGDPVANLQIMATEMSSTGGSMGGSSTSMPMFWNGTTDQNGEFTFGVPGGMTIMLNTMSQDGSYTDAFWEFSVTEGESNTAVDLTVEATDAQINVSLKDQNGAAVTMGEMEYAFISCSTDFTDPSVVIKFFSAGIDAGKSSTTVKVVGGEKYTCNTFIDSKATSTANVEINSGETKDISLIVYETNYKANVSFVDESGNTIPDIDVGVFANTQWESSIMHFAQADTQMNDTLPFEFDLLEGETYEFSYYLSNSSGGSGADSHGVLTTASGVSYIGSFELLTVKTDPGTSPKDITFELQKADATVEVTVTSDNGPVANTWVDLSTGTMPNPGEFDGDDDFLMLGGITDSAGKVSINVLSEREYTVNAWLDPMMHSGMINPAPTTITPSAGQNSLTITTLTPDVTLSVSLESPASLDWAFCAAANDTAQTFADIKYPSFDTTATEEGTLKLVGSEDPYEIFCQGSTADTFYSNQTTYKASAAVPQDSLSLTLEEGGSFYETQSTVFDAAGAKTVTLQDGCSEITFAAKSLAQSGNVSFTFGSNKEAVPVTEAIKSYGLFDFSISQEGTPITDASPPATLVLCYNEEDLPEGVTEDDLTCIASNTQDTALVPKQCEFDTDNNKVTMKLDHFSDYGLNVAAASGSGLLAPNKPKIKKNKKAKADSKSSRKSVIVTWNSIDGAAQYRLRTAWVKKKGDDPKYKDKVVKVKASKKKAKSKKPTAKLTFKKPGQYRVAVAAVDSNGVAGGYSDYSKVVKVKGSKKKKKNKKK